jgi:hypothetical protein
MLDRTPAIYGGHPCPAASCARRRPPRLRRSHHESTQSITTSDVDRNTSCEPAWPVRLNFVIAFAHRATVISMISPDRPEAASRPADSPMRRSLGPISLPSAGDKLRLFLSSCSQNSADRRRSVENAEKVGQGKPFNFATVARAAY